MTEFLEIILFLEGELSQIEVNRARCNCGYEPSMDNSEQVISEYAAELQTMFERRYKQ